jgi:hypothetical protein
MTAEASSEPTEPRSLPSEITRSFGSVWRKYSDEQPSDAQTEIQGNVVRCVMTDAVGGFNRGMAAAQTEDALNAERPLDEHTYRRDAMAAVARTTGRRVLALISKRDRKTDVAREVFILEPARPKRP